MYPGTWAQRTPDEPALPRTPTGKMVKRRLREEYAVGAPARP